MTEPDKKQPRPTTHHKRNTKSILDLTATDAHEYLMRGESYCDIELPPYFVFDDLINNVCQSVDNQGKVNGDVEKDAGKYDNVNYRVLSNKDGKYAWRRLELIHPVIYVLLVKSITEDCSWREICQQFVEFRKPNKDIRCLSIPVIPQKDEKGKALQISEWWTEVEQRSIEYALDYEYVIHTDIVDCYPSIYTHSIPWALHGKEESKTCRGDSLIGNKIDKLIRCMRYGQTNGIPQGSILMDFIAEMVLGYADLQLAEKLEKVRNYKILRYRDDYRIFTNNPIDCEMILKLLAEVMADLGMKLHAHKTKISDQVILTSIKEDKWSWLCRKGYHENLQKHLLIIHNHSKTYPNSGSLCRALIDFADQLKDRQIHQPLPLISIAVDIAYRNPKTYPYVARIITECQREFNQKEKKKVLEKINKKFSKAANTGLMDLWLQRICLGDIPIELDEKLCKLVSGSEEEIWNNEWITAEDVKQTVIAKSIVDRDRFKSMPPVIDRTEVDLFHLRWYH